MMSIDRGMREFGEGEEYAVMEILKAARDLGYEAGLARLIDAAGYSFEFFSALVEKPKRAPSHVTLTTEWSELRAASLDGQSAVVFTPHAAGIQVDVEGDPAVLSGTDAMELASELFFVASERND